MAAVRVPGVCVEAAARRAVLAQSAVLLEDDLEDFADFGGEGFCRGIDAAVCDSRRVGGEVGGCVFVERDEVGCLGGGEEGQRVRRVFDPGDV